MKQNIFKCYVSSFTDGSRNKENAQVRHVSFPCDIIGRVWNLIVSVPDPCSFQVLLWYCSDYSFNIIIALVLLFSAILALFRALYWSHCFPFTFAACCCLEQCKIKQKGKIFRTVKPQWFVLLNRKSWYFFVISCGGCFVFSFFFFFFFFFFFLVLLAALMGYNLWLFFPEFTAIAFKVF